MPIQWLPPTKRTKVQRILYRYKAKSGKCDRAAKAIWRITDTNDRAIIHLLLPHPDYGPTTGKEKLSPKNVPGDPWYFHACVALQSHCVCALTKADGHPEATYLQEHFKEFDAIRVERLNNADEFDQRLGDVRDLW